MAKGKKGTTLLQYQRQAQRGGFCNKCKRRVKVLSVDHIIPLHIVEQLDDTGELKYNWEENLQLLCFPCNRFKSCRLDKSDPRTLKLLKILLTN